MIHERKSLCGHAYMELQLCRDHEFSGEILMAMIIWNAKRFYFISIAGKFK